MAFDYQESPASFPERAPAEMENEVYIDGTLYVDGVPVHQHDRKKRGARQAQRKENPCAVLLRYVRSKNELFPFALRRSPFDVLAELWATQQTERIDRRQHKDKYVRTTLRELMIYLVFLTVLSIGQFDRTTFLRIFLFLLLQSFTG